MKISKREHDQLLHYMRQVARMLNDPQVVFGRFDRDYRNGVDPDPMPNQWVPAYPDDIGNPHLGAHTAPDGFHNVLTIYAANAVGSELQLVFRALEVLEGTYRPQIGPA